VKLTIAEPTPPATAPTITGGPGGVGWLHGAVANGDAAVNQYAAFTIPVVCPGIGPVF
jgi:hypothetical protein